MMIAAGQVMTIGTSQCLGVEMDVGGHPVNILIAIKRSKTSKNAAGLID